MSRILFLILGLLFQCFVSGEQGKGQVQVLLERKNVEHDYSLGLLQKVSDSISLDMIFPSDEYMCHVENVRMTLKNLSPGMNELLKQKNEKVMLEGFKRYLEHMKQVIEESRPDLRRNMRGNLQRLFINFFGLIQKGLMAKIKSCESPRVALPSTNKEETAVPNVPVESKKQENYDNIDVNKAEEIFLSNTLLEIAVQCKNTGKDGNKQLNFLGSFSKCSFSASAVSNSFFSKASGDNANIDEGMNKSLELENQIGKHLEELQKLMNVSKLYSDIFFPHMPHLRNMNNQVVTSEQKEDNGNGNSVESPKPNELYPEVSLKDLNSFQKILEEAVQNSEAHSTETTASADGKQNGENKNELKDFNLLTANILDELAKAMQEESNMSSGNRSEDSEYNEKFTKGLEELDALFDKKLPYEMQLSDIEAVASQLTEQLKNRKAEEEANKQQTTQEATNNSNSN